MTPRPLWLLGIQVTFLLAISPWVNGAGFPDKGKELKLLYAWGFIDFLWPSDHARQKAIKDEEYIPKNILPVDVDAYKDRIFITTPRFQNGTPATLSTISDETRNGQNLLAPFPDWESNKEGNCNGLTSVFHIQIDDLGRLWALDAGATNYYTAPDRICTPQFVVFDLNDGDKIVAKYPIPESVLDCNSIMFEFQIDVRDGNYDNAFIYIVDIWAHKLVVFDLRHNKFTRVIHNSFLPNPFYGDYYIAGTRVLTADGIITIALGPVCNNDRRVYYHALASIQECYVMASTLRDKAYAEKPRAYPDAFYCYGKNRTSQSGPEAMTQDGIMLFDQETTNSINCWNSEIDYNMENTAIVTRNDTTMQGLRGLKLVGTHVYVLNTRHQLYYDAPDLLTDKELNYFVLRGNVEKLIEGTPCKPCLANATTCDSYCEG